MQMKPPGEPDLFDSGGLRARAEGGGGPFLVLVRNRDVGKLAAALPDIEPLVNDWEYSVWEVSAGKEEGTGDRGQGTKGKLRDK